jgi:hypothetical protein
MPSRRRKPSVVSCLHGTGRQLDYGARPWLPGDLVARIARFAARGELDPGEPAAVASVNRRTWNAAMDGHIFDLLDWASAELAAHGASSVAGIMAAWDVHVPECAIDALEASWLRRLHPARGEPPCGAQERRAAENRLAMLATIRRVGLEQGWISPD